MFTISLRSALVVTALLLLGCSGSPGPSDEAKAREQLLLGLSVKELRVPGGRLVSEDSRPGHEAGGSPPSAPELSVRVDREYEFAGQAVAVCLNLAEQLAALGWTVEDCPSAPAGGVVLTHFSRDCEAFVIDGRLSLDEVAGRLHIELDTPYPDDSDATANASGAPC